jgi:hypothetical protein
VELREAVLATRDLQLVYEAEQADASPVAIVRDVLSGRLHTWPDLRAWRRPLPGESRNDALTKRASFASIRYMRFALRQAVNSILADLFLRPQK